MTGATPGWIGDRRRDGVQIVLAEHGFVIIPRLGGFSIAHCPCCGGAMKTVGAAKNIADSLLPMSEDKPRDSIHRHSHE